jgi:hypothetical protein
MHQEILTVTTASNGTGSATLSRNISGLLYSMRYLKTDFAAGVDFTLSVVNSVATETILTITDGNASANYYPRVDSCGPTGSALSLNAQMVPIVGAPKITVAQGGDTKSGTFVLYWLDEPAK